MESFSMLLAAADLGGYVSIFKVLPILVLLLIWSRLLTWMDKDSIVAHLPREILNTAMFITGLVGFALFFLLPNFWIALGVLIGVLLLVVGTYLGLRHQKVGLADLKGELNKFHRSTGPRRNKDAVGKAGEVTVFNKKGAALEVPKGDEPERPG